MANAVDGVNSGSIRSKYFGGVVGSLGGFTHSWGGNKQRSKYASDDQLNKSNKSVKTVITFITAPTKSNIHLFNMNQFVVQFVGVSMGLIKQ